MTPETLALIASYFLCSEAAEVRVLSPSEAEACIATYQNVKLSFLNIGIDEFELMSATERAVVNQRGYAAYVVWRSANQDLVNQMEADAYSAVRLDSDNRTAGMPVGPSNSAQDKPRCIGVGR